MTDKIRFVRDSKTLNSDVFSLPRLLILDSLEELKPDGALYRDIRVGLDLDDGVLYSSLSALKKMGYVIDEKVNVENQKMTSYFITTEGSIALLEVKKWLKEWLKVVKNGKD